MGRPDGDEGALEEEMIGVDSIGLLEEKSSDDGEKSISAVEQMTGREAALRLMLRAFID